MSSANYLSGHDNSFCAKYVICSSKSLLLHSMASRVCSIIEQPVHVATWFCLSNLVHNI